MINNYVAKHMNKVNKGAVHRDRKKDQKKGRAKHKPSRSFLKQDQQ